MSDSASMTSCRENDPADNDAWKMTEAEKASAAHILWYPLSWYKNDRKKWKIEKGREGRKKEKRKWLSTHLLPLVIEEKWRKREKWWRQYSVKKKKTLWLQKKKKMTHRRNDRRLASQWSSDKKMKLSCRHEVTWRNLSPSTKWNLRASTKRPAPRPTHLPWRYCATVKHLFSCEEERGILQSASLQWPHHLSHPLISL